MGDPVRWAAAIDGVTEVAVHGTVDPVYWEERLGRYGLTAARVGGAARSTVVAAAGRYLGIGFREVSVSVTAVCPPWCSRGRGSDRECVLMVGACNSSRVFTPCERWLFKTPYRYADVRVSGAGRCEVGVVVRGDEVFHARLSRGVPGTPGQTIRRGHECWRGAICLPEGLGGGRRRGDRGRYFVADLSGETETYAFDRAVDSVSLGASGGTAFALLAESGFAASEWSVRVEARHARSRTYRWPTPSPLKD